MIRKKLQPLKSITWLTIDGKRRWFDVKSQSEISFAEVKRRKKIQRGVIQAKLHPKQPRRKVVKKEFKKFKTKQGNNYTVTLNIDFEFHTDADIIIEIHDVTTPIIKKERRHKDKGVFFQFIGRFVFEYDSLNANYSTGTYEFNRVKENYNLIGSSVVDVIEKIRRKLLTTSQDTRIETYVLDAISVCVRRGRKKTNDT